MKKSTVFAALLALASFTGSVQAQLQLVKFCASSISHNWRGSMNTVLCENHCKQYADPSCLADLTNDNWQIVASSPKTVPADTAGGQCSCIGTEYVLKKEAVKPVVAEQLPMTSEKIALLEKEIELLKKENGMLQKELNELKSKAPAPKKK